MPFGTSIPFFLSHSVAITFEDAVIGVVRRPGVGSVARREGRKGKGKEGPPPRWARARSDTPGCSCGSRTPRGWLRGGRTPRGWAEIFAFFDRVYNHPRVSVSISLFGTVGFRGRMLRRNMCICALVYHDTTHSFQGRCLRKLVAEILNTVARLDRCRPLVYPQRLRLNPGSRDRPSSTPSCPLSRLHPTYTTL